MQGIITAPTQIITGAFNIRFGFIRPIELTAADVVVETLAGDALGHPKDSFGGSGARYHILCYPPDGRSGKSRISVVKTGLVVEPVVITYDTVRTVRATWGTPIQRGKKVELPITFSVAIENLKKRNFAFSCPCPFQVYGSGDTYSLVVPNKTVRTVSVSGTVRKASGIVAEIEETTLKVNG